MGFLVDAGRTMLPPAKAYQWALDNAVMQVQSGAINYKQAIKTAVKQLADSGLKIVDYESGHRDQIDVAARRAVMTGVSQICAGRCGKAQPAVLYQRHRLGTHHAAGNAGKHRGHLGHIPADKAGLAQYNPINGLFGGRRADDAPPCQSLPMGA